MKEIGRIIVLRNGRVRERKKKVKTMDKDHKRHGKKSCNATSHDESLEITIQNIDKHQSRRRN